MKILLINDNPLVFKLLVLCTRAEDEILETVSCAKEAKNLHYDVLFVDDDSYEPEIDILLKDSGIQKKVLISFSGEKIAGFDSYIQKPFLPSAIIDVLESITIENESNSSILDSAEIEKIKKLLQMDEENYDIPSNEEEYEAHKTKVIKEQLIADGLEIIEEEEMLEALEMLVEDSSKRANALLDKNNNKIKSTKKELKNAKKVMKDILKKSKKIKKLLKKKNIKYKLKLKDKS